MKTKFRYKFTTMMIVCFVAGLLLGVAVIITNSIKLARLIKETSISPYDYISKIIAIIIGILAFIFILPAIINSNYIIKDGNLISGWGLVKSKYAIKNITQVTYFRKTDKLAVYFNDESYLNISIDKSDFESFVDALKSVNKKIFYSLETDVDINK